MRISKYEDLYSYVSYDEGEMMALRMEIDSMVNSDNSAQESNISVTDVLNAVSRPTLKHNKSDGNKGVMSEHVIYACDDLSVHLSMLFSSLLCMVL